MQMMHALKHCIWDGQQIKTSKQVGMETSLELSTSTGLDWEKAKETRCSGFRMGVQATEKHVGKIRRASARVRVKA